MKQQFGLAGLSKLSPDELGVLDAWFGEFLNAYSRRFAEGLRASQMHGVRLQSTKSSISEVLSDGMFTDALPMASC
jgi:hypothetical protein